MRWEIDANAKLKTDANGVAVASEAWYAGNRNIQGASTYKASNGKSYFLLNATRYYGSLMLGTMNGSKATVYKAPNWGYMPEGMYITTSNNMWVATEGHDKMKRAVYYANVEKILGL